MVALLKRMATQGDTLAVLRKVAAQTSNGVAGTRSAHAHGLTDDHGMAVTPDIVEIVETATDADGALGAGVGQVFFVKADATNVTVRSLVASQTFDLYVG